MDSRGNSSAPFFSIIIPAYNAAATIGEALESALAQTCDDYEIIVVDDGSTDETAGVASRYGARVQVISQPNRGLSGARNTGARAARGQWLALLDADDSWIPEKLAAIRYEIEIRPALLMFYSDAVCFTADNQSPRRFMQENLAHAPSWEDMMAGRFQILPSSAVIRRDSYERSGGFSEEFHGASGFEDVYFWLCLREVGPFGYVPAALVNYQVAPLAARLERYRPGFELFKRLVRQRYGSAGEQLIRARRKARAGMASRAGLLAAARGERCEARRWLWAAVREDPRRTKNLLRLLRSYMPARLARKLSAHAVRVAPKPQR